MNIRSFDEKNEVHKLKRNEMKNKKIYIYIKIFDEKKRKKNKSQKVKKLCPGQLYLISMLHINVQIYHLW